MEKTKEKEDTGLLLNEKDAVKFWNDVNSRSEPNKALKKAKNTAEKLLKRKDD